MLFVRTEISSYDQIAGYTIATQPNDLVVGFCYANGGASAIGSLSNVTEVTRISNGFSDFHCWAIVGWATSTSVTLNVNSGASFSQTPILIRLRF